MGKFVHVVTTRFNVPTEVWSVTRDGSKPLSEEWLRDRFEIFRKFCLPSFQNQSNKNFIWLLFFDVNTPIEYQKKIEEFKLDFPTFHPVFVRDFKEMYEQTLEIIPGFFSKDTKFLITTDIDNDDLLHREFIATVQSKFKAQHNLAIDLIRGLQVTQINKKQAFANEFYMIANPFISLVESTDHFGTVMKEKHLSYRKYPLYTFFDAEPRFIQFIHANNLVNDSLGNAKRIGSVNLSDYGIAEENRFKISLFGAQLWNMKRKIRLLGKLLKKK